MIKEIVNKNGKIVGLLTELEPITKELTDNYGCLKFIATPCTGIDHVFVPDGVKLIYLDDKWKQNEGREITSTAEHAWSLILQLAKMKRMQLKDKTIGIIGYGRIGKQVCRYACAFGMRVYIHDIDKKYDGLSAVLTKSDIITIHVPLNESTKDMIGTEQFDMVKNGALLINTSRAEIVDEYALECALHSFKIDGYADDFYNSHNDSMKKLNDRYDPDFNVILTPHIGGNCIEARQATDEYIQKKINEYLEVLEP